MNNKGLLKALKLYIGDDLLREGSGLDENYENVMREYRKLVPNYPWTGLVLVMDDGDAREMACIELRDDVIAALDDAGIEYEG